MFTPLWAAGVWSIRGITGVADGLGVCVGVSVGMTNVAVAEGVGSGVVVGGGEVGATTEGASVGTSASVLQATKRMDSRRRIRSGLYESLLIIQFGPDRLSSPIIPGAMFLSDYPHNDSVG